MKGVEDVVRILKSRINLQAGISRQNTIIKVKGKIIGGKKYLLLQGRTLLKTEP